MMASALFALALSIAVAGPVLVTAERRVATMGTTFDIAVRAATRESALEASEAAVSEVRRVEDLLTTWRDSPLDRVNRAPVGRAVRIAPELFGLLRAVFGWSRRTGDTFDPTVAPLMRAWDLRGAGRIATPSEVAAARAATGTDRFRLDPASKSVARLREGAGVDEGAWGKGYALDRAASALRAGGVSDALLDLGGEVLAVGRAAGAAWTVSLAHPRDRRRGIVTLALADGLAVSTSGNSERGRVVAGRQIGHHLDPRTGSPSPDFGSVVVVAPSAFVADVLSTAFFVSGPDAGLTLSEALRRDGAPNEVLFLVALGDRVRARFSPGFLPLVLASDSRVVAGFNRRKL